MLIMMRMQKPYEEGSILLDAPQHDTVDELVQLARDKEERQGTANAIYPAKRLTWYITCSNSTASVLWSADSEDDQKYQALRY